MRPLIILAFVLFLLFLLYVAGIKFSPKTITQEDAVNFVKEDLKSRFGDANIELMEIKNESNSWKIMTSVTENFTSPCPVRTHVYYDYPRYGFAFRFENITRNCKICVNEGECIVSYQEEAMIASHTMENSDEVSAFLKDNSVQGEAKFYQVYYYGESTYNNVWVVQWKGDAKIQYAVVSRLSGKVLSVYYTECITPESKPQARK